MRVKDCMCGEVCCVTSDATINEVAKIMADHQIGCVPICNNQKEVVGVVTDRDIVLRAVSTGKNTTSTKISEIMSDEIIKTTPDTKLEDASEVMCINQVRRLPVIENNKIVGILSMGDLARNVGVDAQEVGKVVENICECDFKSKNCH